MPFQTQQIDVEDVEYLRHGSKPLLARLFKPRDGGPFPALVDVHGGAWNLTDRLADRLITDRLADRLINEALARSGVVVAALDFRMPPEAPYPASMSDINYGIRWLKTHAAEFGSRSDLVGIAGSSSGGHQAILAAMRPHDARYAAIPLPAGSPAVDATVRCAIMYWPVIDLLGRYHYAQKLKAGGRPYPEIADLVLPLHDKYWKTEEAMAEGSPLRILERGEKVETPPAQYIQGTDDIAHPREHLDRFVECYRKAGGHLELELFEGMAEGFIIRKPEAPASATAIEKIIAFVHEHVR